MLCRHLWPPEDESHWFWWCFLFHVGPPAGQSRHLSQTISQNLQDGLTQYSLQTLDGCQRTEPADVADLGTFLWWHLWFWKKCLDSYWMDCHDVWFRYLWVNSNNFGDPSTYSLTPWSGQTLDAKLGWGTWETLYWLNISLLALSLWARWKSRVINQLKALAMPTVSAASQGFSVRLQVNLCNMNSS